MDSLIANVPKILSYGTFGLGFALALLSYFLLKTEQDREDVRSQMLRAIYIYMSLSIFLCVAAGLIETERKIRTPDAVTIGVAGREAFFAPIAPIVKLDGRWKVKWFKVNENGEKVEYTFKDPETGAVVPYPEEQATIITNRAQVSVANYDITTKRSYWLEGRISSNNVVTLLYWSIPSGPESMLVGTVFLKVIEEVGKPLKLNGWWRGNTRDHKVTFGEIEWTKM